MKRLLVVLDGAGDLPDLVLGNRTPLQAADAPHLQGLAANGKTGHLLIAGRVAPESDVGVCSVLGNDPFQNHLGRGLLEAKGAKMAFKNGDLAMRANFATAADDGTTLLDRRVGRNLIKGDAEALAAEINGKVALTGATFEFKATKGHRGVLVMRASLPLDDHVTNTDPAYELVDGLGSAKKEFKMVLAKAEAWKKGAERSADLVNEFTRKSFEVLQKSETNKKRKGRGLLPANLVLLRDPESEQKALAPLPGKWAILSEMPMEEGIGKLMGMRVVKAESGGTPKGTYEKWAALVAKTLVKNDGAYVHIKGPDLFGHDGDSVGKKKNIELIDRFFFGPLLKKTDMKKTRIAVTADHSTPCVLKAHSAGPVPYLLSGAGIGAEGGRFDEANKGATINGWELMPQLLA